MTDLEQMMERVSSIRETIAAVKGPYYVTLASLLACNATHLMAVRDVYGIDAHKSAEFAAVVAMTISFNAAIQAGLAELTSLIDHEIDLEQLERDVAAIVDASYKKISP